jgi:Glycosyltransferase family 87
MPEHGGGEAAAVPHGWQSIVTMPRIWLAAGLVSCALFAGGVSLFSTDPLHRLWGSCAACAYALAALVVMAWRSRATTGVDVALGIAICGAILVPLLWMVMTGHGEPEVGVVANSAKTLIKHGTPYKSSKVLATTTDPNQYNPYLPLMAVFGVPQAVLGHGVLTDPRVWFGIVFLIVFAFALKIAGARDQTRWALLVTASPVIAFELCVGGTDVPMVAFMCLGFALLWRPSPVAAGLALGIASSMKATAWPALVVAFTLLYARDGKRAAWRFTLAALIVVALIVGPFAILRPDALVRNTILFPLGLASVKSQAASPLLGHVLAQTGVLGHTIAVALLIGSGVAIAVSLVVRPPCDVPSATIRLVIGLSAMFVLAPSTRFGYFIYPAAMVVWLLVAKAGRKAAGVDGPGGQAEPPPGPAPGIVPAPG